MEFIYGFGNYVLPFLAVLTVLVFVHEMGHYLAARQCGVRIEVFSIGFGPEIFGRNDRHGTRWKFSAIPFGGYVRMFGENGPSTDEGETPPDTAERAVSFYAKRLHQRAWIVFRDAECRHSYASWGAGSFRAVAYSACRLELTARRVVAFHARLVTGR